MCKASLSLDFINSINENNYPSNWSNNDFDLFQKKHLNFILLALKNSQNHYDTKRNILLEFSINNVIFS